jgi:hypothetical protein
LPNREGHKEHPDIASLFLPRWPGRLRHTPTPSDISVSKAVAALVRLGLDSQEGRKREFFKKLRKNLANKDPKIEDQMVDEFRALILGH